MKLTGEVLAGILILCAAVGGYFVGVATQENNAGSWAAAFEACQAQKATVLNQLNGCRAELKKYQRDVEVRHFLPDGTMKLQHYTVPTGFLRAYFDLDPSLREVCFPRKEWYREEKTLD